MDTVKQENDELHEDNCEEFVDANVFNLLSEWGLSYEAINTVFYCGVKSMARFKMLNMEDINEIFNTRNLIGDKACFRYHLQMWRVEHNCEPLDSAGQTFCNSTNIPDNIELAPAPSLQFNLLEAMRKTLDGKDILERYSTSKTLNEKDQTVIVRIIVDYFLLNNIRMDTKIMESMAVQITKQFPTENTTTYYIKNSKSKKASGKLYDRYFNQKNKRRNVETPTTTAAYKKQKPNETNNEQTVDSPLNFDEYVAKKTWLQFHRSPADLSTHWKETSILRLKENKTPLKDFLNEWPRYKDSKGFELIDIDFEIMHPGKQSIILDKYQELEKVMIERIFPEWVKDKQNLQYLENLKSATNINASSMYLFNLLHAVIVPPRVSKNSKPSISDAQNDMITHVLDFTGVTHKLNELKAVALQENSSLPVKIFVVGESWENITDILVILNDITYKVETLHRAVDLVIKMCVIFNLEYSVKSKYVWIFLQEFVYKIPHSQTIAKVQNILSKMENFKI